MTPTSTPFPLAAAALCASLALPSAAQSFVDNTAQIPAGPVFNDSLSENVDFADVDLDGDWDAALADGGDLGPDQNRIWINQGGLQGGATGQFVDETAARLPTVLDQSRDIEFVDLDSDGDPDLSVANTSAMASSTNLWWINQGLAQGGSAGFFLDETAARWTGLGSAPSSIFPALVLGSGGWVEFGSDSDFGDLDNDGDLDVIVSSVGLGFSGQIPTRVFLNDGAGFFSEFNPSGFQLGGFDINDGDPGLWCEGTQEDGTANAGGLFCDIATRAVDVDLGDLDGDLDLDLVLIHRGGAARAFRNRLQENGGTLGFRDVTAALFPTGYSAGPGAFEVELGDLDQDDDLDLYGLNWAAAFADVTLRNGGGGFSNLTVLALSTQDDEEGDFLDYDGDGDLDLYVANFAGQDHLHRNDWSGADFSFSAQPTALPALTLTSRDVDVADVDADGDQDVFEANSQRDAYFENVQGGPDTHAPRAARLEQAPDRVASALPTVVRVQVYDNTPDYTTWYARVELETRLDGGPWSAQSMHSSRGQIFRGEIDGTLVGAVDYRVRASDEHGNQSLSAHKSYDAQPSTCNGAPSVYCTAKLSSLPGCVPTISYSGIPSASAGSGFLVSAGPTPGENAGLFVYTTQGALATPVQNPFGFLCVQPGVGLFRIAFQLSGGLQTNCDGQYSFDFNLFYATQVDDPTLLPGASVDLQAWYRDPPNPGGANLTDAGHFTICP